MSCPPDWSGVAGFASFGLALLGLSALLVAMPLGFILWFVLGRTVTFNPSARSAEYPEVEP
jgi:hypothetical protein